MQWSDISLTPSSRTLRQFAGLWTAFFGGLACWQGLAREHTTLAVVLGALAITIGPLGLVWPQTVRLIYVGWTVLVFPVGWLVLRIIMAALFYGVFTPIALVFRLSGRDALGRSPGNDASTYWTRKPMPRDARSYFRQF